MDFISTELADYCEQHTTGESALLQQLNRDTHARVLNHRMLSGHLQGRLLSMISHMIRPRYVLEIGTYTGYSALCLCEGLAEGGQLITIDCNDELEDFSHAFFEKSPWKDNIRQMTGDARTLIHTLEGEIDLAFIDADKENYPAYLELVYPKLKTGGFILADNVLWSGHVLRPAERQDAETAALIAFNDQVRVHPGLEVVMLPVRDGLSLIRKR